jgi:hypothetical protein
MDSPSRSNTSRSKTSTRDALSTAPAWRTFATVLIILHLFCVAIGVAVNAGGGRSMLAPALYRIPAVQPYLKLLWMNFGYDFLVSSPLPEDGSHRVELTLPTGAVATTGVEFPAEIPPLGMQPRIRRQRYQQLAYNVAFLDKLFAENSDIRTALPLTMAETWLRELNAPQASYELTCTSEPASRLPKAIERAPSKPREGGPRMAGPATFEPESFAVHLVWDPEEARYQGSRAEPEGQVSHVVRDQAGIGTSPSTSPLEDAGPPAAINPADANVDR